MGIFETCILKRWLILKCQWASIVVRAMSLKILNSLKREVWKKKRDKTSRNHGFLHMWVKWYTAEENTGKIQDRFEEIAQKITLYSMLYSIIHHSSSSYSNKRELRGDTILRNTDEKCFLFEKKCEGSDWKQMYQVPIIRYGILKI